MNAGGRDKEVNARLGREVDTVPEKSQRFVLLGNTDSQGGEDDDRVLLVEKVNEDVGVGSSFPHSLPTTIFGGETPSFDASGEHLSIPSPFFSSFGGDTGLSLLEGGIPLGASWAKAFAWPTQTLLIIMLLARWEFLLAPLKG